MANRQLSLEELEDALDSGQLEVAVTRDGTSMRWWMARRNGKTKRWKRDRTRWEVPIKAGLRVYYRITDLTPASYYRIKENQRP